MVLKVNFMKFYFSTPYSLILTPNLTFNSISEKQQGHNFLSHNLITFLCQILLLGSPVLDHIHLGLLVAFFVVNLESKDAK